MSSSKGSIAKTLICVAVPSLVAGYLWWQQDGAEDKTTSSTQAADSKKNINTDQAIPSKDEPSKAPEKNNDAKHKMLIESMKNACGSSSSIVFAEVQESEEGKGRGLFTTKQIENNELFLRVRPSLTLLFEPYCFTHCLGCYSSLLKVPGRQCQDCKRFAVCQECDVSFGLYDWHVSSECKRWNNLPQHVTNKPRSDVLWLLVRYRSCMDRDMDFRDISTEGSSEGNLEKEPLELLEILQANPVNIPKSQLVAFSSLTDLSVEMTKQLIMQLRTNAGTICEEETQAKMGMALSAHLGFVNHSCRPNCVVKMVAGYLEVKALRPLAAGEEVTMCYVDESASVLDRRAILSGHYQFDCDCERCKEELALLGVEDNIKIKKSASPNPSSSSPRSLSDSVEWEKIEKPKPMSPKPPQSST